MIAKEQEVLLGILKGNPPNDIVGVNLTLLFELFQRHRLFPIASSVMNLMDEANRQKWKEAVRVRTVKSMQHTMFLARLTEAFKKEGIEVIPLKGPVLSQDLYGSLGERHFRDLDILIRGENVKYLVKIAEELDFELIFPKPGLSSKQWQFYLFHKKHIGLLNRKMGVLLELHTSIENHVVLTPKDVEQFLEKPVEVRIGETRLLSLNRNSNFLYLVVHGGVHQFRRLFWLRDIAEAIQKWDLDHKKIFKLAQSTGVERILGVSLLLSEEFFNSEIPEVYNSYLLEERKVLEKLQNSSRRMILGPEQPTYMGRLSRQYFMFRLKRGLYYKFRVISETMHRLYIGRVME